MISKYDVLAGKGSLQGIYGVYQTTNGRTSWKSAQKAIWFVPGQNYWDQNYWVIGDLNNIGSDIQQIRSSGDQDDRSPSDVPKNEWRFYNDDWIYVNGDIIVQCKNDTGKIIQASQG